MEVVVETITPEVAEQYLKLNTSNRKVRQMHVNRIAKDIESGKWHITGDAIRFNGTALVDGQHRLLACVKSKTPIKTLVVRGLSQEVYAHIDTNCIHRQASDVLSTHGISQAKAVASIVRMAHWYLSGRRFSSNYDTRLANDEVVQIAMADPAYGEAARFSHSRKIAKVLPESLLGCWFYLTAKLDEEAAQLFWDSVSRGVFGSEFAPRQSLLLREKLFENASAYKKMNIEHKFAYGVRAWNSFREGREITKFLYTPNTVVPRFI